VHGGVGVHKVCLVRELGRQSTWCPLSPRIHTFAFAPAPSQPFRRLQAQPLRATALQNFHTGLPCSRTCSPSSCSPPPPRCRCLQVRAAAAGRPPPRAALTRRAAPLPARQSSASANTTEPTGLDDVGRFSAACQRSQLQFYTLLAIAHNTAALLAADGANATSIDRALAGAAATLAFASFPGLGLGDQLGQVQRQVQQAADALAAVPQDASDALADANIRVSELRDGLTQVNLTVSNMQVQCT
jgi:hypothetical protein